MGLKARICVVLCAVSFLALNIRLFIHYSLHAPLKISRHSVFPSSADELTGASAHFWCKDRIGTCSLLPVEEECRTNATIREDLCKESCDACEKIANQVSRDVSVDVHLLDEPVQFFCKDVRTDCKVPGFEEQCEGRAEEVVAGCKASCGYCNSSSFLGSNPLLRCGDYLSLCPLWKQEGRCSWHWMPALCRSSCGLCSALELEQDRRVLPLAYLNKAVDKEDCRDYHTDCPVWKLKGACIAQREFMSAHCAHTCDFCMEKHQPPEDVDPTVLLTRLHSNNAPKEWFTGMQPPTGKRKNPYKFQLLEDKACPDQDNRCIEWAGTNQCDINFSFMAVSCPAACGLCQTVFRYASPSTTHLQGDVAMPSLGLGTAGMGGQTTEAVLEALKLGYRHIDTAQAEEWYAESMVGEAIKLTDVPRGELFITTKLHPRDHGFQSTLRMFNRSLERLHTSYIDLFLLHYPECWGDLCQGKKPKGTWQDSWRALEHLKEQRKVLAIGVSNFNEVQLRELLNFAKEPPAVLQAHSDPLGPNWALQTMCRQHGIAFVAYSSLGTQHLRSSSNVNPVLTNPVIKDIAARHKRSTAQIVLAWALQHGQVVIPRSLNPHHMRQNKQLNFALTKEEVVSIDHISNPS